MDESSPYPPIDPTTFDLIIIGTGLPESILSAAASSAGKSVLHLDPNPFYGSHFSSLSLQDAVSFLHSHPTADSAATNSSSVDSAASEFTVVDLIIRPLISDPEVSSVAPELERCGRFGLDVSGPRVLFCADSAVDLMITAGISDYLDFKCVDASFVYDGNGGLSRVPGSRSEIFSDRKSLKLTEKKKLMGFFNLVQEHLKSTGPDGGEPHDTGQRKNNSISAEDMDKPFMELLTRMELPAKLKSIILYAIAMENNDQEEDACKPFLKTNEAMSRLALYLSSIGRFPNTTSGMLYPMYGHGEIPQAFCRRAAVKGCIYVLRMPVVALLLEKDSRLYKGIKLGSGQQIFSHQLVLDPCFKIPPSLDMVLPQGGDEHPKDHCPRESKVARGICITRKSINSEVSNLLIVYPPKSLYPQQTTSVRALQIGSNLSVCPSDMFVFYLSTPCEDASEGKKSIKAAIDALFPIPNGEAPENITAEGPENSSTVNNEDMEDYKPTLLWRAIYIQEVLKGSPGSHHSITFAPSPDTNLSYNDLVDESLKLFHEMYPDAEIFPEKAQANNSEEDEPPKDKDQPAEESSVEPS